MSFPPTPARPADAAFARVLGDSLRFHWEEGNVCDVPAGYTTGWRVMPYALIGVLMAGESVLELDDRPPQAGVPGLGSCIPAGTLHRITHPVAGVSSFAHATFTIFSTIDVLALARPPMLFAGAPAQRLAQLAGALATLAGGSTLATICARQALGLEMLGVLLDAAPGDARSLDALRAAERLVPVMTELERDLGAVDLAAAARLARLSPSHLNAVFHDALGCSPMRWVRRRRMERARELLAASDLPVGDIAERCGFPDQFHFSRAFKRAHGASPSAYRVALAGALL